MEPSGPVSLPHPPRSLFTSRRRRGGTQGSRGQAALFVMAAVAIAGTGAWYWVTTGAHALRPAPADDVAPEAPASPAPPRSAAGSGLPGLDASDALVRELAAALSKHPGLTAWLASEDLVRRYVVAVSDVARGASPRQQLPFMVPDRAPTVRATSGRLLMSAVSWRRYDALTATFSSLDPAGVARLHVELRPLIERAWAELGLRDTTYDEALARAFGRLLAVRVPEGAVEVTPSAAVYAFADPALEGLGAVEKHLVRMGPGNARRLQAHLRELASAMGVEPGEPGGWGEHPR